jgi:hypothetical protein
MAGTWQRLTNQPPFSTSTMLLLTDGRVMVRTAEALAAPERGSAGKKGKRT